MNLQEAANVFILDPWWNPQVEAQAIQRAHRLGQKHKVSVAFAQFANALEQLDCGFGIWHLAFGIWHLAVGIWYLAFGIGIGIDIWHLAFGIRIDRRWHLNWHFWFLSQI